MAMDFKQIQELIRMVNKSNIGELTIEEKGFHITIKQKSETTQHIAAQASQQQAAMLSAPQTSFQPQASQQSMPADQRRCSAAGLMPGMWQNVFFSITRSPIASSFTLGRDSVTMGASRS